MNRYFNSLGGVGWWLNRWISHDLLDSCAVNAQITFFDRYIIPISKAIDPATSPFFGQSFICVVEKQ